MVTTRAPDRSRKSGRLSRSRCSELSQAWCVPRNEVDFEALLGTFATQSRFVNLIKFCQDLFWFPSSRFQIFFTPTPASESPRDDFNLQKSQLPEPIAESSFKPFQPRDKTWRDSWTAGLREDSGNNLQTTHHWRSICLVAEQSGSNRFRTFRVE